MFLHLLAAWCQYFTETCLTKKQTRTLRKCGSLWRARAKMFLLQYADVSLLRHRCEVSYWKKYVRHTAFSIPFCGIRYDTVSTNWNLQQAHPVTAPRSNSSSSLDRSILLQTCVKAHGVDRCLILNTCGNGTEHTRIQMLLLSVSSILLWHWGPSSCNRLDYITKTNFVEFEDDHYQEAAARNALLLLVSLLKSESWMPWSDAVPFLIVQS